MPRHVLVMGVSGCGKTTVAEGVSRLSGLVLVHLHGSATLIHDRIAQRTGHYMPASLLDSQLATLEPLEPDEAGIMLDAAQPSDGLVASIIARLRLPVVHPNPAHPAPQR